MIGPNCGWADLLILMEFDCFSSITKLDKTASSHTVLPRLFRFASVLLQFCECEHPYWQIPKSVEYFFSMMRSEHHTGMGMHSFHNILISKSALVFLEQLQGRTPFLISHCIHDADSSSLGSLFVWILCDLISNGGSTRHQRYWFGAEGCLSQ